MSRLRKVLRLNQAQARVGAGMRGSADMAGIGRSPMPGSREKPAFFRPLPIATMLNHNRFATCWARQAQHTWGLSISIYVHIKLKPTSRKTRFGEAGHGAASIDEVAGPGGH